MVMADANDRMEVTAEGEKCLKPEDKVRHRKKHVFKLLRKQMEFYFSDANLTKDRFLSNLVERDKYVDISIFLRFNKVRAITSNISDIAKSLRDSELLSVTEDGTKVFRTSPVKYKDNEEECTVYVEELPPDADHEWLKRVFSSYGEVVYVSIPKYKQSNKIKGFAFVEFDTPEAATKTLEAFGAMGCRLPAQMLPDNLCSITTFEQPCEENENGEQGVKPEKCDSEDNENVKHAVKTEKWETEDNENGKHAVKTEIWDSERPMNRKKRKLEHPDSSIDSETGTDIVQSKKKKKKKQKGCDGEEILQEDEKGEESSEGVPTDTKSVKHAKKRKSRDVNPQIQETETESKTDKVTLNFDAPISSGADELEQTVIKELKPKKLKQDIPIGDECEMDADESRNEEGKKKKKNRNRNCKKKMKRESDPSKLGLKILSKREWKRLRNKYLDLQRSKMKAVKQHLARARWGGQTPHACSEDGEGTPSQQHLQPECPRTVFTPGVIARVVLNEPVPDVGKFKSDVRAHTEVQYVDVLEGATEAYVRFSNSSSAAKFAKEEPFGSIEILSGEEETNYWNKIKQDRTAKFSLKVKVKQRGRDKLLKRVERELGKHIRFDE